MMRQAGRTLPEYRALKEGHSFWELCKVPELAAEVTLQPVRRFAIDAAILFSDILVVPAAMGMEIEFTPAPIMSWTVKSGDDLKRLKPVDVGASLKYVADAIGIVRREIGRTHAVLGFSGAPYTLACYMIDGTGAKGFSKTRALMHSEPALMHRLLDQVSDVVADYLTMQAEAGVTAFQLFDSWAGDLGQQDFSNFAAPYVARVLERASGKGASSIYFVNGIAQHLGVAAETGADVLGIDWRIDMAHACGILEHLAGCGDILLSPGDATSESLAGGSQRGGDPGGPAGSAAAPRVPRKQSGSRSDHCSRRVTVQGNLDPAVLFAPPHVVREKTHAMLDATNGIAHIANLGHGLAADTPLEGIEAFVNAVVEWKPGEGAR